MAKPATGGRRHEPGILATASHMPVPVCDGLGHATHMALLTVPPSRSVRHNKVERLSFSIERTADPPPHPGRHDCFASDPRVSFASGELHPWQQPSAPVWAELAEWLDSEAAAGALPKSLLGKATGYRTLKLRGLNPTKTVADMLRAYLTTSEPPLLPQ